MANVSSLVATAGGYEPAIVVVASNTTQALAVLNNTLPGAVNALTTVPATSGAALPPATQAGQIVTVINTIATATSIYPQVGGKINAVGALGTLNAAVTLAASGIAVFISCGPNVSTPATPGLDWVRIV